MMSPLYISPTPRQAFSEADDLKRVALEVIAFSTPPGKLGPEPEPATRTLTLILTLTLTLTRTRPGTVPLTRTRTLTRTPTLP